MRISIQSQILREVKNTIEQYRMLHNVRKVVVAFSGGADSVCLLNVLYTLFNKRIQFCIMYVNHGLRSQKILQKEENLTKFFAIKYSLQCKIARVSVTKSKTGIEAAARDARYAALIRYMADTQSQCIALGHNSDDVVETFLMNVIRGSGASGLTALQPVRTPYIRPFLYLKKGDILKFVRARKLPFSEDETNQQLEFRRNLLRHKVIPELVKINPELRAAIQREIDHIHTDDTYLEKQAEDAYKQTACHKNDHILLDIKKLFRYDPAITGRVVRKAIKELNLGLEGFESKHIAAILGLKSKESAKRIDLPKKLYAQREFEKIAIGRSEKSPRPRIRVNPKKDTVNLGNWVVKIQTVSHFDLKKRKHGCEVFDLDQLKLPLVFRTRRQGDTLITRTGKRMLKKVYSEHKIPPRKRQELLMLCDQRDILMIPGIVRAYRAYVERKTKMFLVVDYEHTD